jgi:hypothetical protein
VKSGIKSLGRGVKGKVNALLASNLELVLSIPGSKLYKQFVKASEDVEATQNAVLREVMGYACETEFGAQHDFGSVRTYDDYRKAVPVADYEAFRPLVDRHARGEADVLFPGKPMMYTHTSGTTAKPKLLPITRYNFERCIKNRGKLWLYGLMRDYPGVFKGKDLTVVSPAVDGHTEDGTPCGSMSGVVYQNIPEFMKLVHTLPYEVVTIKDYEAKVYALVRFALPSDVSVMLTANPATVLNLVTRIDGWKEELFRDIRDGTLRKDLDIDPEIRAMCEARFEPAPDRAAELEKLAGAHDRLLPTDYWPNLRLIHTWTNGNCALVVPKLRPWFGESVPILDFGYLASELTGTDLLDKETNGSVIQVRNAFFEFTPCEEEDAPKTFLMAHQLEQGRRYFVYITTFSGLYRYDMNDILEVVGHFNQVPILKFIHKGKGITSLQGEKLSELQLIEAVKSASAESGIDHEFFIGFADALESRYDLYLELRGSPDDSQVQAFGESVDRALARMNEEYEAKRKSMRLGPVRVVTLGEKSFDRYRMLRLEEGAQEGQLKWMNLSCEERERERLHRLADSYRRGPERE